MNSKPFFTFLLISFLTISSFQAKYSFSGEVDKSFSGADVFLFLVDDYRKIDLNIPEQIIKTTHVNEDGVFEFKGNDLPEGNKIYKIFFNNCADSEDKNYFLKSCDESNSFIFIANNSDSIYLPVNSLNQSFCEVTYSNPKNLALFRIDSLQNHLLHGMFDAKSDSERKLIYKNWFEQLKTFSAKFKEPLAELYAYKLYSDDEFMGRSFFEEDLKKTHYYDNLLKNLNSNETYSAQFEKEIAADKFSLHESKTNYWIYFSIILVILLLIALFFLFKMFQKLNKIPKKRQIKYKEVLTQQEQAILALINEKLSNKEIADKLFISLSTVKTHINNIYSKLGINSRKEVEKFF